MMLRPPHLRTRGLPGRAAAGLVLLVLVGLTVGCVETREVGGTWHRWRELADPPRGEGQDPRVVGQAWAVELQTFTGRDRLSEAFDFSNRVRAEGQIADVWFVGRGQDAVVYTGRYPREDHPEAVEKLKSVRQATLNGKRPFRNAKLVTIERGRGTRDANDLSQYSGRRTLLVAVYDASFGDDFRRAAEEYAEQLRAEHDHPIYYYHGPSQSLVTAGLFTQYDFIPVNGVDSYGPRIRELQEIFPHTRRNGELLRNPELTTEDQLEPTIVVRVP